MFVIKEGVKTAQTAVVCTVVNDWLGGSSDDVDDKNGWTVDKRWLIDDKDCWLEDDVWTVDCS